MKTEQKYCPMTFNSPSTGSTCIGNKCQWWIEVNKSTGQREKVTNNFIYEDAGNCCFVKLIEELSNLRKEK